MSFPAGPLATSMPEAHRDMIPSTIVFTAKKAASSRSARNERAIAAQSSSPSTPWTAAWFIATAGLSRWSPRRLKQCSHRIRQREIFRLLPDSGTVEVFIGEAHSPDR